MKKISFLSILITLTSISFTQADQQTIHCPTDATMSAMAVSDMVNFMEVGSTSKVPIKLTGLSLTPSGNNFTLTCQYPNLELQGTLVNFSSCKTNTLGKSGLAGAASCKGSDCDVICETGNIHVGEIR